MYSFKYNQQDATLYSITDHMNANEMQIFMLFIWC